MTIDKQELKALAEAATPGPWKKTIDGVMPEGRGFGIFGNSGATDAEENRTFIAAANPATILALLAEIEQLRNSHEQVCTNYNRVSFTSEERGKQIDQLKAENEAMRKLKLPHYLKLSDEMRAAGDHAELRAREDQCYSVPVLKAVFFEAAIQRWLDDQEEAIDAALAKEASR